MVHILIVVIILAVTYQFITMSKVKGFKMRDFAEWCFLVMAISCVLTVIINVIQVMEIGVYFVLACVLFGLFLRWLFFKDDFE